MRERRCRRLTLHQGAEGAQVTAGLDDPLDDLGPERADQLVLQVGQTGVEAEGLQLRLLAAVPRVARVAVALAVEQPDPDQPASHEALLGLVVEPGHPHVAAGAAKPFETKPFKTEPLKNVPDIGDPAHGEDLDPLRREVHAAPRGQHLERRPVAHSLDEHDRASVPDLQDFGHTADPNPRVSRGPAGIFPPTD